MILGKIVAGALALIWDIESAFVGVTITDATITRATNTCTVGYANATLSQCGMTLNDNVVGLINSGVAVLNHLVAALNLSTVAGR